MGLFSVRAWTILAAAAALLQSAPCRADDHDDCFTVNRTDYDNADLFDATIQACTRYIKANTGSRRAEGFASRASYKHKKGDFKGALKDFDAAIEINPDNAEFYDYRGETRRAMGDDEGAIADYERSIRIDPTYAASYYDYGQALEKQGLVDEAILKYRAALKPPLERAVKMQERIQKWAQDAARQRLKQLEDRAPEDRAPEAGTETGNDSERNKGRNN